MTGQTGKARRVAVRISLWRVVWAVAGWAAGRVLARVGRAARAVRARWSRVCAAALLALLALVAAGVLGPLLLAVTGAR